MIQGLLNDAFFETANRRPHAGDVIVNDGVVWMYGPLAGSGVGGMQVWTELCRQENEPEGEYDLDFQIPGTEIVISQPLAVCLEVLFRFNAMMPTERAQMFVEKVLAMVTEAQWRSPEGTPGEGRPGVLVVETGEDLREYEVANIGPAMSQLRNPEVNARISFIDAKTGELVSIDPAAFPIITAQVAEPPPATPLNGVGNPPEVKP